MLCGKTCEGRVGDERRLPLVKAKFGSCQIKDLSASAARIPRLRRNVAIVVLRCRY